MDPLRDFRRRGKMVGGLGRRFIGRHVANGRLMKVVENDLFGKYAGFVG